ncbi:ribbon-helix-helix domain-containing protein [Hyphobacterium sp. HN65]|uniref:Ribbon-helix-helix domain-containing protein n=1 Tax=Hyphobacterium lacteum TaxID=3116575 RepID=A0ABU7LRT5_9PROT|nr:ribbon-helix-helix domain-containing protein [Hyphobacterium sp. HN65]MEE2526299.1 ribbon-helix-helix domain-containing protein [Hyphobacterium sp. HN65]
MLVKRSISIAGHRTSLALEPEFWAVLDHAAEQRGLAFAALIRDIDEQRAAHDPDQPLSSACRVFALSEAQKA